MRVLSYIEDDALLFYLAVDGESERERERERDREREGEREGRTGGRGKEKYLYCF